MDDKPELSPEDVAAALAAIRQLVFAGLIASAKTATQSDDQQASWLKMSECDSEVVNLINRISPGSVAR